MADTDAPGGGVKDVGGKGKGKGLTKKVGPLPLWAWCVGGGVILGGLILVMRRNTAPPVDEAATQAQTGGINEDAYGAGYQSGAGSWDGGSGATPTAPIEPIEAAPAPIPQTPYDGFVQEAPLMPDIYINAGGVDETPKAPAANKKKSNTDKRAQQYSDAKKKDGARLVNTTNNARKGQSYKVTTRADGSKVHTYANGKKVVVKPQAKSTNTPAKIIAGPKVNKTSNARAGKTYTTIQTKSGAVAHDYGGGNVVVVRKAPPKPKPKPKPKRKR